MILGQNLYWHVDGRSQGHPYFIRRTCSVFYSGEHNASLQKIKVQRPVQQSMYLKEFYKYRQWYRIVSYILYVQTICFIIETKHCFEDRIGSHPQAKNEVMTYSAVPNKQSSSQSMCYTTVRILENCIANWLAMARHVGFHFCHGHEHILFFMLSTLPLWPNQPHILCIQWVSRGL